MQSKVNIDIIGPMANHKANHLGWCYFRGRLICWQFLTLWEKTDNENLLAWWRAQNQGHFNKYNFVFDN